jgi:hypothetical protein
MRGESWVVEWWKSALEMSLEGKPNNGVGQPIYSLHVKAKAMAFDLDEKVLDHINRIFHYSQQSNPI